MHITSPTGDFRVALSADAGDTTISVDVSAGAREWSQVTVPAPSSPERPSR
ncbi:hypothetical protein [Leifsonia xyli]|uniref:hypothetical protein n=1 Tax=Leifsonia xyli TaxID=1575 RepID=UPI003D67AAB3